MHEQEWYLVLHFVDYSIFRISSRHLVRLICINLSMNIINWNKYFLKHEGELYEALYTDLIIDFKIPLFFFHLMRRKKLKRKKKKKRRNIQRNGKAQQLFPFQAKFRNRALYDHFFVPNFVKYPSPFTLFFFFFFLFVHENSSSTRENQCVTPRSLG